MAPDSPDQIQHVSDTALMVAACRALETTRPDGLVRDPFAERLAGPRGDAILQGITGWQLMCFGIGVRTCSGGNLKRTGGKRLRRLAWLRSIPLNNAPDSCAVISRHRSAASSPNGMAWAPSSSRLLHTAKPSRSQHRNFDLKRTQTSDQRRHPTPGASAPVSRADGS